MDQEYFLSQEVKKIRIKTILHNMCLTSHRVCQEEKIEYIKIKLQEEENKKRREEIKKTEQIYNSLDTSQQEEIRIETENRLPEFWKGKLNKIKVKGETSKFLDVVLEEKRREIIKEWIESGKIKDINSNVSSDKKGIFYPEGKE